MNLIMIQKNVWIEKKKLRANILTVLLIYIL